MEIKRSRIGSPQRRRPFRRSSRKPTSPACSASASTAPGLNSDMHIAFVHSGADLYGASRALLRLAAALIERGRRVTVILPYDGDLRPALERCGATVLLHSSMTILTRQSASGSIRHLLLFPFSFFELVRLFRRLRPDVVHSNTAVILSAAPAAWILGIPHICHIREFFAEFPILWKFYRSYLAWFSTAIVCVSHAVAAQFEVGIRE